MRACLPQPWTKFFFSTLNPQSFVLEFQIPFVFRATIIHARVDIVTGSVAGRQAAG
jgi:hypothetical protein